MRLTHAAMRRWAGASFRPLGHCQPVLVAKGESDMMRPTKNPVDLKPAT